MSTVGVVVPCYRYGHLLRDSVGSVLDQHGVDVRVLIIDDASPDDSAERAREIAAGDSRVEVAVHVDNRGHIRTYNEGLLEWCDTDYAVLLSADDMLTPGSLGRAVDFLDATPEAGLVYGHYVRFDGKGALPPVRTGSPTWRRYEGQAWLRRRFSHGNGCIASPEVVVRTSVQQAVGGYDPALPHTGDIEMWMRFAARADLGYLRGVDQAYYRVHDLSMSTTYYADGGLGDLRQRWAAYAAFLEKDGDRVEHRMDMERTIRRRIARDALWRACRALDGGRGDREPVDALVAFALETYDGARGLSEYRGLRWRRAVGNRISPTVRRVIPTALWRRARQELWWRQWKRSGV